MTKLKAASSAPIPRKLARKLHQRTPTGRYTPYTKRPAGGA